MDIGTLVERAKSGDSHALAMLYKMYFPKMKGKCINIIKDENMVCDLVHDAFILAFSSLHNLHKNDNFGQWLTTIVRNVALKYIEKKKRTDITPLTILSQNDERLTDRSTSAELSANLRDITEAVNKLPDGYSKVFRMNVIEGFSHKEIAEMLGIEPHSSSSQLSRAKTLMRKLLDHKLPALVILMILTATLFIFIGHDKTSRPKDVNVADNDRKKSDINESRPTESTGKMTKGGAYVHKKKVAIEVATDFSDFGQIKDTAVTEVIMKDVITAETKKDSVASQDNINTPSSSVDGYFTSKPDIDGKGKWQMLTTGSLGPALAQNVFKLIATGHNGGVGIDSPTFPENVRTWEDYSICICILSGTRGLPWIHSH